MSIGFRLKKIRQRKKLPQKEVARRIGISNSRISNYERNYREPPLKILVLLADLYDVSTDYILGRTSNPKRTENNYDAFKEMYDEIERLELRKLYILKKMSDEFV